MHSAIVLFITTNGVHNAADQFYVVDHCFRSRTVDSIHRSGLGLACCRTGAGSARGCAAKRLPSTITIASGSGTLECSSTTTLTYQIPDWTLNISIDSIDFAPAQDQLVLEIYGDLSSDQIVAGLSGDCSIFEDLSESCDLALPTTAFSLVMPLSITLSEGELVVSAPDPVFEISELGNPVDNCLVADAVDTILGRIRH